MNKNVSKNALPNKDSASTNFQSTSSFDTATATSLSTTAPTSIEEDKYTIADVKHLVNTLLLMVPTQNIVSEELPTLFSTLPIPIVKQQEAAGVNKGAFALRPRRRERSHLAIAMEIMDEIEAEVDESENISDAMDSMNLQEDNNEVEMNADPDLFEESLTKLLQPRKKERHYFSMADDILRDLVEEDGEW